MKILSLLGENREEDLVRKKCLTDIFFSVTTNNGLIRDLADGMRQIFMSLRAAEVLELFPEPSLRYSLVIVG